TRIVLHRIALLVLAAAAAGCVVPSLAPGKPSLAPHKEAQRPPGKPSNGSPAELAGIGPCEEGSAPQEAAREKLQALRKLMKEKKGAAFAEAVPKIKELLASPCYRRLSLGPPVHLDFDGPLALEKWWDDGAEAWLETFVFIRSRGDGPRFDLFVGPDVR